VKSIHIIFLAAAISISSVTALTPNLPAGTLQQWRVQPRTVYKLYVPVRISGGKVHLGSTQPL